MVRFRHNVNDSIGFYILDLLQQLTERASMTHFQRWIEPNRENGMQSFKMVVFTACKVITSHACK